MKLLMLIVMFLFIGVFFIISQNNLPLNSSENADKFISLYKTWLEKTFQNAGNFVGHVVKMEWLPE